MIPQTIKGIVKESAQAVKEYREAVSQGKGAYLLRKIFPMFFYALLSEKIRFVLPTVVSPRYSPGDFSEDVTNRKIVTAVIQVTLVTSIESPSHLISTELNINGDAKVSRISLSEEITYLERDFILVVKSNGLDEPRAFIEYNPKTETNAVMLTLVPNFAQSVAKMSEMVFVVDRSDSMSSGPIRRALQALQLILQSIRYSKNTFSKAFTDVKNMGADCGGTEIKGVLECVVKTARSDMPTSRTFRLFSLGIGSRVSHHLIESIARAVKGYSQFVTDGEHMDKKVVGMIKNAIKNALTDYKVEWIDETPTDSKKRLSISSFPWDSSKKNETKFRQAPNSIPAIYSGVRVVVYAILAKGIKPKKIINLSAQSLDSPINLMLNFLAINSINEKTNSEIARSETLKQKREVPRQSNYMYFAGTPRTFHRVVEKSARSSKAVSSIVFPSAPPFPGVSHIRRRYQNARYYHQNFKSAHIGSNLQAQTLLAQKQELSPSFDIKTPTI
ncbi:7035_t:CDS:2 [Ambispora gerdemannii]|uniref:7035_t:CDS:1 n=1 Tax=Ambispora gerdemannii TaxID=144530 RepID=A0A9N9FX12_9GLOM|nr:7035_t:CDS:2 [Ambispora gerdemannii]